ncbi:hypothetical protein LCGC14_2658900 [marine sediment metagenome]|uniref:Uncharacterized protein n=1 Tax=marine sediment metagenome TaxID=412755 RepID=A0A0F9C2V2_9ZZZZ
MEYDKKSGVFHYFILTKIKEKRDGPFCNLIERAKVREVLYNNHVPIKIHNRFLKEMENFRLIKITNRRKIRILK